MTKPRKIDELYLQYEYLAVQYSKKVFDAHRISRDSEDMQQDFKIKLFQSIQSYVRKYNKWWNEDKRKSTKPMPILIYLKTAMGNFFIDYIKKINRESEKMMISVSVEEDCFDYGIEQEMLFTDLSGLDGGDELIVNGVDLLNPLEGLQRKVFIMYLKGHTFKTLDKVFKNKLNRSSRVFINKHLEHLRSLKSDLYIPKKLIHYCSMEEE